jgi:hypothetical protein
LNNTTESQDTGTNKISSGVDLTTSEEENCGKKGPSDCRKKQICREFTPNKIWRDSTITTPQEAEVEADPVAVASLDVDEAGPQYIANNEPLNKDIPMIET